MEGFDKNDELNKEIDSRFKQEIFSKAVRAGKRTYFFDVKSTRKDEYYLTITESKKRFDQDGKYHFEKHKIFLYKEDFVKFKDGLGEIIDYITERQPMEEYVEPTESLEMEDKNGADMEMDEVLEKDYTNVDFEDLSK